MRVMYKIFTSIQTSHPLYLAYVSYFFPDEVREHPHWDERLPSDDFPVVLLKHFGKVSRHIVRDHHHQLVATLRAAHIALVSSLNT